MLRLQAIWPATNITLAVRRTVVVLPNTKKSTKINEVGYPELMPAPSPARLSNSRTLKSARILIVPVDINVRDLHLHPRWV